MQARTNISQSFLKTWMACSLQAKFQYHDRLPRKQSAAATFGTCIHHALELYNNGATIEDAKASFVDNWDNPEKLNVTPEVWPKYTSYGSYRERGLLTLQSYHDTLLWDSRDVLATEHEFSVPFGEFVLHGFVDLVERRRNSRGKEVIRIVDYKTNKRQPNFTALNLDIQFTTYVYAATQKEFWVGFEETPAMLNGEFLWEMCNDLPVRAIWYHLDTNKDIDAGARDQKDFERLYRACKEIKQATEKEVYVPDISGATCLYCPYTEPCGITIPTQQEIEQDEDRW